MNKVSVIMPAYNAEAFIRQSMESVLSQTHRDIELIVVNDGSTDRTLEIAQAVAASDRRVRIVDQPNSGRPSIARNAGLRIATGDFIAFLDSDDLYAGDRIEKCVAMAEAHPGISVFFHNMEYITEDGVPIEKYLNEDFLRKANKYLDRRRDDCYILNREYYKFMCLYYAAMHVATVFVRHDLLERRKFRFREDILGVEDTEAWINICENEEVAYLDRVLSSYRDNSGGISKNRLSMLLNGIEIQEENFNKYKDRFDEKEIIIYRHKISSYLGNIAYQYFMNLDMKNSRKYVLRAFRWFRRKDCAILYAKTFIPNAVISFYRRQRT